MHAIPTHDGRTIHYYPHSACAAIDGRLYFTGDGYNTALHTLSLAVKLRLRANVTTWGPHPRCPTLHSVRVSNFHGPAAEFCTTSCVLTTERVQYDTWSHPAYHFPCIDTANPRLRRLQRWWRSRAARMRQERRLAVVMGLHDGIGRHSAIHSLEPELVRLILRL